MNAPLARLAKAMLNMLLPLPLAISREREKSAIWSELHIVSG